MEINGFFEGRIKVRKEIVRILLRINNGKIRDCSCVLFLANFGRERFFII